MKTFTENLNLIKDTVPNDIYVILMKLTNIEEDDDHIRKLAIANLLDKEYYQELDWLYSTLRGQKKV